MAKKKTQLKPGSMLKKKNAAPAEAFAVPESPMETPKEKTLRQLKAKGLSDSHIEAHMQRKYPD